jgi:hypothetical protein
MHPRAFLETRWRRKFEPEVFVAMNFAPEYDPRYDDVIAPAVRGANLPEVGPLKPFRVNHSDSGDSIVDEIVEHIAHCRMVVADVSATCEDAKTHKHGPNGNVMYEVGLALACRQTQEVLLIGAPEERLFDISIFPHNKIDFDNVDVAKAQLQALIERRLKSVDYFEDQRVQTAVDSVSIEEFASLNDIAAKPPGNAWANPVTNSTQRHAIARLLDKGLVELCGKHKGKLLTPAYRATELGKTVADKVKSKLPPLTSRTDGPSDDNSAHGTLTR